MARDGKTHHHGRVDVRPGKMAARGDDDHYDQPKSQGDPQMAQLAGHPLDQDPAAADDDQGEGPQGRGQNLAPAPCDYDLLPAEAPSIDPSPAPDRNICANSSGIGEASIACAARSMSYATRTNSTDSSSPSAASTA